MPQEKNIGELPLPVVKIKSDDANYSIFKTMLQNNSALKYYLHVS